MSDRWLVQRADISTAFLNGDIDGEVYVSWDNVCNTLKQSLYGLKQLFPRLCFEKLKNMLEAFDSGCMNHASVFSKYKVKCFR